MIIKIIVMKTKISAILIFLISSSVAIAGEVKLPTGQVETGIKPISNLDWLKNVGLSYFTFFDGPGLAPGMSEITPNVLGKPADDGLRLSNYASLKYNLTSTLALDFQMRIQWILNNANQVDEFKSVRWQSPRVGVSGKLLAGQNWSLSGAVNTDFPYFFPQPIGGGVAAQQRTTIFNPGLFAKFSYIPSNSRWSIFSLVMPRILFYSDRNVAEPQLSRAGFSPTLKNEFIFSVSPSANYALTHQTGLRFGTELTYNKLILSSWNPFHATINNSDISSDAWRLAPVPLQAGVTHEFSSFLNVSIFLQAFPIAGQRVRRDGSQATFYQTASVGMWISGTLI
jgi:hypothetical protein